MWVFMILVFMVCVCGVCGFDLLRVLFCSVSFRWHVWVLIDVFLADCLFGGFVFPRVLFAVWGLGFVSGEVTLCCGLPIVSDFDFWFTVLCSCWRVLGWCVSL